MAPARSYGGKTMLVLLIMWGTLASQAAWVTPAHSHRGVPAHCCGVCHAGHLPLVEAGRSLNFIPAVRVDWLHQSERFQTERDAPVVLCHSRAPPA